MKFKNILNVLKVQADYDGAIADIYNRFLDLKFEDRQAFKRLGAMLEKKKFKNAVEVLAWFGC